MNPDQIIITVMTSFFLLNLGVTGLAAMFIINKINKTERYLAEEWIAKSINRPGR